MDHRTMLRLRSVDAMVYTSRVREKAGVSRTCGRCSVCCVVMAVDGLEKPAFTRCEFVRHSGGCRAYDERPEGCRIYECHWLGGLGERKNRPDRMGILFHGDDDLRDSPHPITVACEVYPGKLREHMTELEHLARTADGVLVTQPHGDRVHDMTAIGPRGKARAVHEFLARRAQRLESSQ